MGEPGADGDGSDGVRSVLRALDLLALFDDAQAAHTVRELIEATGLAKSTVVRLVATLERRGLLWTRPDGRVAPGPGLLHWARLAQDAWQMPPEASECLRRLSADSGGESSRIYVRQENARVCVAQHEGTQQLRHVIRVGERLPLWAGASGHVLLTAVDPHRFERVVAASGRGDAFAGELSERVRRAERQGWAVSHGEREQGVSAVAAPVTDASGRVVAAAGLGGATTRFTDDHVAALVPVVVKAAERLSELRLFGGAA